MRLHILGICGTFMGGLALLARDLGFEVSGSDMNVYPPMSDQLRSVGIELMEGYLPQHLSPHPDMIIIGNSLSRGNDCVEYILDHGLPFTSGPRWLAQHILAGNHVLAVSGTHGKTTTTGMLAWILESAGRNPGFLVGGIPENFGRSARPSGAGLFVLEADEYDTAFFDKRSKFIHYFPRTLIINNIEFDHADIFSGIAAIRREFHHLVRTIPAGGKIIINQGDAQTRQVLAMGCWTPVERFGLHGEDWSAIPLSDDFSRMHIYRHGRLLGDLEWDLIGRHNAENALAAIAAGHAVGVAPDSAISAMQTFKGIKRRMQKLTSVGGINIYDDFAHHPTAIRSTLTALRNKVGSQRIITILEARSNTMKMGVHRDTLAPALAGSDAVRLYQAPDLNWDLTVVSGVLGETCGVFTGVQEIIDEVAGIARPGDHIVIMSNGGFQNIHQRLIARLSSMTVSA